MPRTTIKIRHKLATGRDGLSGEWRISAVTEGGHFVANVALAVFCKLLGSNPLIYRLERVRGIEPHSQLEGCLFSQFNSFGYSP
jgi:hypothetical protein